MQNLSLLERAVRVLWETDGGGTHRWDDLYEYPYNEHESRKIVARLRSTAEKLQKIFSDDVLPQSLSTPEKKRQNLSSSGTARFTEPDVLEEVLSLIQVYAGAEAQIVTSSDTQTVQLSLSFKKDAPQLATLLAIVDGLKQQELSREKQKKREQLERQLSAKRAELDALEHEIARFS